MKIRENKQKNKASIKGIIITSAFVVLFGGTLIACKSQSTADAAKKVRNELVNQLDSAVNSLEADLSVIDGRIDSVSQILETEELNLADLSDTNKYLSAIEDSNAGEFVYILDDTFSGLDQTGADVSLSDETLKAFLEKNDSGVNYFCADIDGKQNLIAAKTCKDALNNKYYILSGFQSAKYDKLFGTTNYGVASVFVIVDREGTILSYGAGATAYKIGTPLLDHLSINAEEAEILKNVLGEAGESCTVYGEGKDTKTCLINPILDSNMSVVVLVNQAHINKRTAASWKVQKDFLTIETILLLAFIIAELSVGLKEQFRNTEDKKNLEEKADTDLLTGLNNKLATERKIKEYIEEHPNRPGMMLLIDVDDFKKINDTKGHAFGDEVLRSLGEKLNGLFRYTDIVGRIGGDEFMVFLKDIEGEEVIRKEAVKVIQFFDSFTAGTDYIKYSATASIGVALYPSEGMDFDGLYKSADNALYKSKKNGKNQLNFVNDDWDAVKP